MAIATRRDSWTPRTRTAVTFAAASLLSIVIAPAAFAAPNGDPALAVQPGDGAAQVQVDTAGAVASEASGASNGSGDLESAGDLEVSDHLDSIDAVVELDAAPREPTDDPDGDAAATATGNGSGLAGAACDDHLVTLTPSGASGLAPHAVAITAQAHEYGQPGWDMASWAASEGTMLRTVIAEAADGATSTPSATRTGTAYDVAALTFCGTATSASAASGASAEAAAVVATDEPTTTPVGDADRTTGAFDDGAIDDGASDDGAIDDGSIDDGSNGDGSNGDDEPALGVIRVDTTSSAPTAYTGSHTASGPASGSAPGDDLATVPIARTSPSAELATSTTAFGSTTFGSTTIGLLTVGLLGAALLALAAFRRPGRTEHAHLGGQA